MDLPYTPIEDAFVRLEPLADRHRQGLAAACDADPALWTDLYPHSMAGEHFESGWKRLRGWEDSGMAQNYAVLLKGEVVGMSCFLLIDHINDTLEVGHTYYRPEVRGGMVNPAAKRLLMTRAFEGGARRVMYKVDAINARSRAAVLKLGAVQEGILRHDRITWTGRQRSTVVFSILAAEWPDVRDKLERRLEAFAPVPA